jgi:acyl transferase domain-containing protein
MLANRLSYFYNISGPSISIDTACSSSLVALHLACQSLKTGESKTALVGGVNCLLNHDMMISMSTMRFLAPEGRSYAFDYRAQGYGRGEGVTCLLLKPLEDALRDGNSIRGIIRNTGVNQDGKTPGITFPSISAQSELIRKVYQEAGLRTSTASFVECHGTGTPAGDPIEASAIHQSFCFDRTEPLCIGSAKTNVGHLEGASGLVGLIKVVLMLERKQILPNARFDKPNSRIPLNDWKLKVSFLFTYPSFSSYQQC